MHKFFKVLLLGLAAGILDAIPLAFLSLTWQSVCATLLYWLVMSVIICHTRLGNLGLWSSGMCLALLTTLPRALLTHPENPGAMLQMLVFAVLFGGLLGYTAQRLVTDQP